MRPLCTFSHLLRRRSILPLAAVFVLVFFTSSLPVLFPTHSKYSDFLLNALDGPISYSHPELIRYIQNEILEPPSSGPYNLLNKVENLHGMEKSEIFYNKFSIELFSFQHHGFFVEAGALDGETMSNTLWLEQSLGWSGLLVEPDPSSYKQLKLKNRKAWTANVCLALNNYPKKEQLGTQDIISDNSNNNPKLKSMGFIVKENSDRPVPNELFYSYYSGQCFSLNSLLLAMNVTRIDLLSLDVEFVEEDVLRNLDFQRFDIQVLYIEWWAHDKALWLKGFLEEKGYVFIANIYGDMIYVKKGTDYQKKMDEKHPIRDFRVWQRKGK